MKSRNRLQRISFLVLSLAALVHGCAWDDSLYNEFVIQNEDGSEEVVRCGDSLEKIIIYKGNNASETFVKNAQTGKYANAFEYNLCPRDAPNCIKLANDEQPNTTKGICHSCPEGYAVCNGKCLERAPISDAHDNNIKFNPSLHIKSCDNDNLVCDDDYHNVDGDSANGCEFPLRTIHVKKDSKGKFVCDDDYYDLNGDIGGLDQNITTDGCEHRLSPVYLTKDPEGHLVCVDGHADIDRDIYNGCEIDGLRDPDYCGVGVIEESGNRRQGTACKKGVETCIMGSCQASCGQDGITVCDGYCVNVQGSDNAHCGDCGKTCEINDNTSSSTAAVACRGGECHATACNPGYRLETGRKPNTCIQCNPGEYTKSATATKCEECPKTPGAKTMRFDATRNLCVAETCKSGWYYHDPCAYASQSCTEAAYCDTTQHCKSKSDCATPTYGSSSCVDGKCEYACNAGYYYLNGCEKSPYCCHQCPNGTYKASSGGLCTAVPAGKIGYHCDNTSPRSGCRNYQSCSTTDQCQQMYGSRSWCSSSICHTSSSSDYSCNMAYDGCPSGKTCKAYNQSTYGYCSY